MSEESMPVAVHQDWSAARWFDEYTKVEAQRAQDFAELIAARAEVEQLTTTVDTLAKHLRAVTDSRHDMERNFRRANMVVAQQAAEIERLKQCLKAANANHEKFERLWYLEQDKNAQQAAELQRLTGRLNGSPWEDA